MTFLEVTYRYQGPLRPKVLRRIGDLPGRYGIRRVRLDEQNSIARIEFDASRLKETEVVHWVRAAGLSLTEKVVLDALPAASESGAPEKPA